MDPSRVRPWLVLVAGLFLCSQTASAQNQNEGGRPPPRARASARATGSRLHLGSQMAPGNRRPRVARLTLGSEFGTASAPAETKRPRRASGSAVRARVAQSPADPGALGPRLGLGSGTSGGASASSAAVPSGRPASATVAAPGPRPPSGRIPTVVPALQGPVPRVSTNDPGIVVLLCDVSGSMRHPIAGAPVRKAEAAAEATNNALMELILAHTGGDGRVRNRLNVMLLQYGAYIRSGLRGTVVTLADLAEQPVDFVDQLDANGQTVRVPIWVRPQIDDNRMPQRPGGTPMTTTFAQARRDLRAVLGPPGRDARRRLLLAFNLTDGEPTDGSPEREIATLAREADASGHDLIMTNIHITDNPHSVPVLFPTEEQAASFDSYGQQLFRWSSPVPAELLPLALELNPDAAQGTGPRMMAVNANLEGLNSVLQAGSSLAASAPVTGGP